MDFTCELAKVFGLSPFNVLEQDKDSVIMMINYFVEKGQQGEAEETSIKQEKKRAVGKNERIRVNDKTATGGWF